ncbi:unnamed protein product [Heligmosomoides polygyrus]|uniref:Macro domain-containing protein n=1 Tax=Heligmosomoides polygyrus TaxID=6339 RepID=A0A183GJV7_HELPZ|nr:unnamed protein product [Heligmosomoides polygyrus]
MEERDTTKENATPEEISRKTLENEESEWEACVRIVEEGKNRSLAVLSETRVSKQARGARLTSAAEKGHLMFQCVDECFSKTTLGDIDGVVFPGAYGRQPFSDVWTAWKAASIFIREDLPVAQKIRLFKDRAVVLDAEALRRILKLAYSVCTEWTEFICTTGAIAKHEAIEDNCVLDFCQNAFEQVKEDLKKEARTARKPKEGPTGFAAPETAHLMEKDGPRCGLITKVVLSYGALKDVLKDWKTFGTWIIVYPIEAKGRKDVISEIVKLIKLHLQAGGRIITAWTPITAQKEEKWLSMTKLWRTLDDMILKFGGNEQVVVTASNIVKDGKLFVEQNSCIM